jgi:hypothetical protein
MSFTVAMLNFAKSFSSKPERSYGRGALSDSQLSEVEATVRPILVQLEALRRETVRNIDFRAAWMIPLCFAGGFVFGMIIERETPVFSALMYGAGGAMGGWAWAFTSLNNAYRRAYKSHIIPHLAACFGELGYRHAEEPDLKRLAKLGLIPGFGVKKVEDEILGTYHGVPVKIVEAKLETGGKNSRVVFNGLLAELAFPGRFSGVTVVAKDGGLLGNTVRAFVQASGLERARLEDPRFEERYQVYSSDQISVRALLTPAVMERLMELERHTQGDPPRLVAEYGTLRVALSKGKTEDLFEPPSIANPLQGSEMLLELSSDIGSVLKLVDAVLELTPMAASATPARKGAVPTIRPARPT